MWWVTAFAQVQESVPTIRHSQCASALEEEPFGLVRDLNLDAIPHDGFDLDGALVFHGWHQYSEASMMVTTRRVMPC